MGTKKEQSVSEIIVEATTIFCAAYCKYRALPAPPDKEPNWLITDNDSPCRNCPLLKLL